MAKKQKKINLLDVKNLQWLVQLLEKHVKLVKKSNSNNKTRNLNSAANTLN